MEPQLPTHHFTGASSATGLSTSPDLLDRHHGPPHRICLTGALVHHSVGPSLTPSSAPSLALHTSPRPPQQIRLTESTVHRARRSLRPLHQTRSTDAIFNSTGPALLTPQPHQVISICTPSVFSSLSWNCSLTTYEISCMSTGAATEAPEPLQQHRQPAQTQLQHEHHR